MNNPSGALKRWFIDGNRFHQLLIVALALAVAAVWALGRIAERDHQLALAQRDAQAAVERDRQSAELLEVVMEVTGWLGADALERGSTAELQRRAELLVKRRPIDAVVIADAEGTIVATTNKKWHGDPVDQVFPGARAGATARTEQNGAAFRLTVPLHRAEGGSLGTAVIVYAP